MNGGHWTGGYPFATFRWIHAKRSISGWRLPVSTYLSSCPRTCRSTHLSAYGTSICISVYPEITAHIYIYRCFYPCTAHGNIISIFICYCNLSLGFLSIYLSVYLSMYLSIYLSVDLSTVIYLYSLIYLCEHIKYPKFSCK